MHETSYTYGGLRNAAWVSERFEMSRRRDNLSWGHHYETASYRSVGSPRLRCKLSSSAGNGRRWIYV